jgi:hypothetical protein
MIALASSRTLDVAALVVEGLTTIRELSGDASNRTAEYSRLYGQRYPA